MSGQRFFKKKTRDQDQVDSTPTPLDIGDYYAQERDRILSDFKVLHRELEITEMDAIHLMHRVRELEYGFQQLQMQRNNNADDSEESSLRDQLKQLLEENMELKQELDSKSESTVSTDQLQQLQSTIRSLQEANSRLSNELSSAQKSSEQTLSGVQIQVDALRGQVSRLESENAALLENSRAQASVINDRETKTNSFESERLGYEDRLRQLMIELDDKKSELDRRNAELLAAKTQIEQFQIASAQTQEPPFKLPPFEPAITPSLDSIMEAIAQLDRKLDSRVDQSVNFQPLLQSIADLRSELRQRQSPAYYYDPAASHQQFVHRSLDSIELGSPHQLQGVPDLRSDLKQLQLNQINSHESLIQSTKQLREIANHVAEIRSDTRGNDQLTQLRAIFNEQRSMMLTATQRVVEKINVLHRRLSQQLPNEFPVPEVQVAIETEHQKLKRLALTSESEPNDATLKLTNQLWASFDHIMRAHLTLLSAAVNSAVVAGLSLQAKDVELQREIRERTKLQGDSSRQMTEIYSLVRRIAANK
eukprot:c15570_g1_i1.p1 GENE.c15570_g1_i1~~c15570_g1_i1.p1  ORF type:complete len:545 (+),score=93.77 c15570_g1_i1:36-1637(+)